MTWWLSGVQRATEEQSAIAELAERSSWLKSVTWKVGENLQLTVDFDITHEGEAFALSMAYPSTFPDTPPIVKPRGSERISGHQYGVGGELCLEHRPDNWDPAISGAMMIESAYRLISGERPETDTRAVVPSAHQESLGRTLRGTTMRFMLPKEALDALNGLATDVPTEMQAWDKFSRPTWVAAPISLGPDDSVMWSTTDPRPASASLVKGFAVRTEKKPETDPDAFLKAMPEQFPALAAVVSDSFNGFILVGQGEQWTIHNLYRHEGKRGAVSYGALIPPATSSRLPSEYEALAGKHVGIVGCGSVGSKIGVMLARAGIRTFTLVDDDVLFVANLVRNELAADGVGLHKVDGLAIRLKEIAGTMKVTCRHLALGQQASAGFTESVMQDLAKADLLIDATADPRAFNLVGAVARRKNKPFVWCQVFAGGIGGVVARLRPGHEPVPSRARDQVRIWCDSHGVPWQDGVHDYSGTSSDGTPLVADDADVSVIAGHAARFALDTLGRKESIFPEAAYAIGLAKQWIFSAPFDTWPIALRMEGIWGVEPLRAGSEAMKLLDQFIEKLLPSGNTK